MRTLVTLESPAPDRLGVTAAIAPDFHDPEGFLVAGSGKPFVIMVNGPIRTGFP
jgi:hypothetical protein